jgi:hypothetical protein
MKKLLFLFLFFFSIQALHAQSEAQHAFVRSFLESVAQHDSKAVIQHLDKAYRKAQIKFLNGNTTQFLDELLNGTDIGTGEWVNIRFADITRIEVAEVVEMEDGNYEYIFRVRTGTADILSGLLLHVGKKFGFEGSRG